MIPAAGKMPKLGTKIPKDQETRLKQLWHTHATLGLHTAAPGK